MKLWMKVINSFHNTFLFYIFFIIPGFYTTHYADFVQGKVKFLLVPVSGMELRFEFVLETVLITWRCFCYC